MDVANVGFKRPRVLLMTYACVPHQGSEPGLGWNRAIQTAKHCDTWVICEGNECSEAVRDYLKTRGEIPGLTFEFLPKNRFERLLERVPGLYYLSYNLWHRRAFRAARRLHAEVRFDLVHQVNLNGYREPGYLWRFDVPFVWGPVGGTQNFPWRFLGQAGIVAGLGEMVRNVINSLQLHFSRRVRRAARKAGFLFTANSTGQTDFARIHGTPSEVMCDVGINDISEHPLELPPRGTPLRILWSGELRTRKGLPLLLQALARLPADVVYEVHVLGEGPQQAAWQKQARRLGVDSRFNWMGQLRHSQALQQLRGWADVFVFTSLRDTSGTVVLEAFAAGVPVVCLDHQGMHDIVTPACGVKIPVTRPGEVIDAIASALARLARDPSERQQLGYGGLKRAHQYLYSRQVEKTLAVYRRLLGSGRAEADRNDVELQPATSAPDLTRQHICESSHDHALRCE
jgi:glycosyltransferase involved in cell wall biosynthesis